jgi:hypothetical protein
MLSQYSKKQVAHSAHLLRRTVSAAALAALIASAPAHAAPWNAGLPIEEWRSNPMAPNYEGTVGQWSTAHDALVAKLRAPKRCELRSK